MRQIRRTDLGTLGYVIYQMLTGMILTIDKSLSRILRITPGQDNKLNISEQNISDDAKELLTELIQKLARSDIEIINSKEITQAIKKMSFLNKIDWDKLEKGELESMFKPDNVRCFVYFFKI
jgi:serine/threonine protein kinase